MSGRRKCRKCGRVKPLSKFQKNSRCRGGRAGSCYRCRNTSAAAVERQTRYDRTVKGKARWLVKDHGFSSGDALILAERLLDPYTRCSICGVPLRWLLAHHHAGWKGKHWRGLSVDHIAAGGVSTLRNTRILCRLCNTIRGAERHTDEEVLFKVRWWYENRGFASKDLWWMCSAPGRGGHSKLGTERLHEVPADR